RLVQVRHHDPELVEYATPTKPREARFERRAGHRATLTPLSLFGQPVDQTAAAERVPDVLVHRAGDSVGIAVRECPAGPAVVLALDSEERSELGVSERIPFGHKVALVDIARGAEVIERCTSIGAATAPIEAGALVHVHN